MSSIENNGNSDLQGRTKKFSLEIIKLYKELPKSDFEYEVIAKQLMRAGTSVGANTRAAFRGRSKKEFIAKLGIVIEEADECIYWLELLEELTDNENISILKNESEELVSIFVSISKRTKESISNF